MELITKTRVIIAGCRDFDDYEGLKRSCDKLLKDETNIEIISGAAPGADTLGEKYAKEKGFDLEVKKADWKRFGKSAGFIRNKEMLDYALESNNPILIAFWDGKSRGTKGMIEITKEAKVKVFIIEYKNIS